jgi:Sec-independent protein translocase protein TatA
MKQKTLVVVVVVVVVVFFPNEKELPGNVRIR